MTRPRSATRPKRRPAQVILGRRKHLGERLNTAATATICPACRTRGQVAVHELAIRWPCGHTRDLPPLRTRTEGVARA